MVALHCLSNIPKIKVIARVISASNGWEFFEIKNVIFYGLLLNILCVHVLVFNTRVFALLGVLFLT